MRLQEKSKGIQEADENSGIPTKSVWDKNYETYNQFTEKLNKQMKFLDSLQFRNKIY